MAIKMETKKFTRNIIDNGRQTRITIPKRLVKLLNINRNTCYVDFYLTDTEDGLFLTAEIKKLSFKSKNKRE